MTFEEEMLKEYFNQLSKQFSQYNKCQQHKILESVRSLVVEPKIITNTRPLELVLDDIRVQIEEGGRASFFFTTAFINWYRTGSSQTTRLYDYINLDLGNRYLFIEMIGLRDSGRFDDEMLYQFEQYCLSKISQK